MAMHTIFDVWNGAAIWRKLEKYRPSSIATLGLVDNDENNLLSSDQNPCEISLCWLDNPDPYIGLL